jgi:hypothetical protein
MERLGEIINQVSACVRACLWVSEAVAVPGGIEDSSSGGMRLTPL